MEIDKMTQQENFKDNPDITSGEAACRCDDINHRRADELTTEMHAEMMEDEIPYEDMMILGVLGAMNRGITKEEALRRYGITEEEYDNNIDRVLNN